MAARAANRCARLGKPGAALNDKEKPRAAKVLCGRPAEAGHRFL